MTVEARHRHPGLESLLEQSRDHDCPGLGPDQACVRIAAVADLPTRFGRFQIVAFENPRDGKEHVAIVHGDPVGHDDVPVRLHSECLTGDALGSLRCDCRDQLQASLRAIAAEPYGVVLYLRQEGRGIGLLNKLRAYQLQDHGMDTVEANLALGFRDDERDYAIAAHMLMSLRIGSVRLMTNNPRKIAQLEGYGITVAGRIPLVIPATEHNRFYLSTKATRSGHLLGLVDAEGHRHTPEQLELPIVDGMSPETIRVVESPEPVAPGRRKIA